jgi:hypothetical protein
MMPQMKTLLPFALTLTLACGANDAEQSEADFSSAPPSSVVEMPALEGSVWELRLEGDVLLAATEVGLHAASVSGEWKPLLAQANSTANGYAQQPRLYDGRVYFKHSVQTSPGSLRASVQSVALGGGAVRVHYTQERGYSEVRGSALSEVHDYVVDGDVVYAAISEGLQRVNHATTQVLTVPNGCTLEHVVQNREAVFSFASCHTVNYRRLVYRTSKQDGSSRTLLDSSNQWSFEGHAFALDAGNLYWYGPNTGTRDLETHMYALPLEGGPLKDLSNWQDQAPRSDSASDDGLVYHLSGSQPRKLCTLDPKAYLFRKKCVGAFAVTALHEVQTIGNIVAAGGAIRVPTSDAKGVRVLSFDKR